MEENFASSHQTFNDDMQGPGGNSHSGMMSTKRRSRYDTSGRDFKCNICEKTYLSYPAMYTHMKNKHALDPQGVSYV